MPFGLVLSLAFHAALLGWALFSMRSVHELTPDTPAIAADIITPSEFLRLSQTSHAELAWDLGRRALIDHPEADALYIGGGSWMAEPVCRKLEGEFGKPVICNQTSRVRHILRTLGAWTPIKGHGRLLEAA